MSDITRYDHCTRSNCYGMRKRDDGDYVEYEDYEKLERELAANKQQLAKSIEREEQIERELTALRSEQMTEAKAMSVLGFAIKPPRNELRNALSGEYIMWRFDLYAPKEVSLDGRFTALQLSAIAWWMDAKGGER